METRAFEEGKKPIISDKGRFTGVKCAFMIFESLQTATGLRIETPRGKRQETLLARVF